jgi:hypothetical protein
MHKTTDAKEAKKQRKLDQELDKALEETFPGSDPVSINQPAPHSNDKNRP